MASVLNRTASNITLGFRQMLNKSQLLSRSVAPITKLQSAGIAHKDNLDPEVVANLAAPWPYEKKRFNLLHDYFGVDGYYNTTGRFTENSRVITVEGNVGSGKSVFAKQLAEELGMKYFPELDLDVAYITSENFDYRSVNKYLPLQAQFPELSQVFEHREPSQAAVLQHLIYRLRYVNYLDALTHLYQTGQGVVVERSPWSDSVFAEHLKNNNFYSSSFRNFYWVLRSQTICQLQRPHLVIYVDVDADQCRQTIEKRNKDFEVKHLTKPFLQGIEQLYKNKFLPRIEKHAELMMLKMDSPVNEENVKDNAFFAVCDIENIDFERFFNSDRELEKMDDWKFTCSESEWNDLRRYYSNQRQELLSNFYLPDQTVPEFSIPTEMMILRDEVLKHHGPKFLTGQNQGFFKTAFTSKKTIKQENYANWFFSTY